MRWWRGDEWMNTAARHVSSQGDDVYKRRPREAWSLLLSGLNGNKKIWLVPFESARRKVCPITFFFFFFLMGLPFSTCLLPLRLKTDGFRKGSTRRTRIPSTALKKNHRYKESKEMSKWHQDKYQPWKLVTFNFSKVWHASVRNITTLGAGTLCQ